MGIVTKGSEIPGKSRKTLWEKLLQPDMGAANQTGAVST